VKAHKLDGAGGIAGWGAGLMSTAEQYLANVTRQASCMLNAGEQQRVCTYLFTLGDVAQVCHAAAVF
jgi:hypothetical protein